MPDMPIKTADTDAAAKVAAEKLTSTNTFLYAAIADTQGVIRALDTKLSVALVIFTLALPKFDAIYAAGTVATAARPWLIWPFVIMFVLAWSGGLVCAFRGLVAIDNPGDHIEHGDAKGAFYCGGHFTMTFKDSFQNAFAAVRPKLLNHQVALPADALAIQKELAYEQLKLAYIRAIKIRRVSTTYMAVLVWIASGALIWTAALAS